MRQLAPSLRLRLLAGTSLASLAVLALLGVAIFAAVRRALSTELDASLRVRAAALASMTEQDAQGVTFDGDRRLMSDFSRSDGSDDFEIWLDDGSVLARSPSLGEGDLSTPPPAAPAVGQAPIYRMLGSERKENRRAILIAATPPQDGDTRHWGGGVRSVRIMVARPTAPMQRQLWRLAELLAVLCLLALAASGMTLLVVVRLGLRPLDRFAGQLAQLEAGELDRRFHAEHLPAELRPVVEQLNAMLARLARAFERERAFAADVAHELRTPLAGLQTTLEVCRSRPRDARGYEAAIDRSQGITRQMRSMVQNLLLMARAESGELMCHREPVNLPQVIEQCVGLLAERAAARRIRFDVHIADPFWVESDGEVLHCIIRNLAENAVAHADEGGTIFIGAARRGDSGVAMTFSNPACRLSPGDGEKVFHRFWRGEASRADSGKHFGLGLSLCQRLLQRLGGSIGVEITPAGRFDVCVEL